MKDAMKTHWDPAHRECPGHIRGWGRRRWLSKPISPFCKFLVFLASHKEKVNIKKKKNLRLFF